MAITDITVAEKFNGRTGTSGVDGSAEVSYIARSTQLEDDLAVKVAVLKVAPGYWPDADGVLMSRVGISDFQELGGGGAAWAWEVRVGYSKNDTGPLDGSGRFTFKTSGGSKKINYSRKTARYNPVGGKAKNHNGAISVSGGMVQGTEIVVPVYEFTETHAIGSVSDDYKRTLFTLTGRVNSKKYKGLDPGECLFMGAEGERSGRNGTWEITFNHAGSPNTYVPITGITGSPEHGNKVPKGGWEYLWVEFDDYDDNDAHGLAKTPLGCYVELVYEEGDMGGLGIGTS
jgi:hypothetical protein